MTSREGPIVGGCLCGEVRYEGAELWGAAYCHCRRCQKSTGGPFLCAAQLPLDSFRISRGSPRWYRSSEICDRGFCSQCGTPLFFRYLPSQWSDWVLVAIGSLDDPESVRPERHFGVDSKIPWLEIHDDLPSEAFSEGFIEKHAAEDRANPKRDPVAWRLATTLKE